MNLPIRIFCAALALLLGTTALAAKQPDPDAQGDWDVGFTQLQTQLPSGNETTVFLWYPIEPGSSTGTADYPIVAIGFGLASNLLVPSALDVTIDAPFAAGVFPLALQVHGGGVAAPPGTTTALAHMVHNELLASHGVAVASFSRRSNLVLSDTRAVLDAVTLAYPTSIDAQNIGLIGGSAGNREASALAAGVTFGTFVFAPDPRVTAVIYQDGGNSPLTSTDQFAAMSMPTMVIGGSALTDVAGVQQQFDAMTGVSARRLVTFNTAAHLAFQAGSCRFVDAMRGAALQAQSAAGVPLSDPLTTFKPPFAPGGSVAGVLAFVNWNFNAISGNPALGEGREYCPSVGANDPLLPTGGIHLDYTGVNFEGDPVLPDDELDPLHARYVVSFMNVHLSGKGYYNKFLTPGAANGDARVSVHVTGGNGN